MALHLARYNARETIQMRELSFESAADAACAAGYRDIASREDMIKIFDWVLSSGGEEGAYWPEIKAFGGKYGGSRSRKLSPDVYVLAAEFLKDDLPRVGLAMWRDGWASTPGVFEICKGRPRSLLGKRYRN